MTQRCLVVGASGLMGSHLLQSFPAGWEVFGISRRPLPATSPEGAVIHHLPIDLSTDWDPVALPSEVDVIIHLAQSEHFRAFPEQAEAIFQLNTHTTLKLLNYARLVGTRTFVLASSGGIYGYGEEPFRETDPMAINGELGFYLGTKYCSEILAESYKAFLNLITLRFFFVYGPGQNQNLLIPRLIQAIQTGSPITLQGSTGLSLNPIYVTDAAQALLQALVLERSEVFNIAGSEVVSLEALCRCLGRLMGKEPVFQAHPEIPPAHIIGDITKMTTHLGAPAVSLQAGLQAYLRSLSPERLASLPGSRG